MFLKDYKPSITLQGIVDRYWISEIYIPPGNPTRQSPLPKANPLLYFSYSYNMSFKANDLEDNLVEMPQSFALGLLTRKHINEMEGEIKVLGVFFKPAGLFHLFGIPMPAFTDKPVALEGIIGLQAAAVVDKLAGAESHQKRIAIIEEFLISQLKKKSWHTDAVDSAAEKIWLAKGNISVAILSKELKIGERQLRREFVKQVGISIKYFARMTRFNHSITLGKTANSWLDVVDACGYYDQAHFIKEVCHFSGQSPTVYFRGFSEFDAFFQNEEAPNS